MAAVEKHWGPLPGWHDMMDTIMRDWVPVQVPTSSINATHWTGVLDHDAVKTWLRALRPDTPSPIDAMTWKKGNGRRWYMQMEQYNGRDQVTAARYLFENPDDALMFKLRFG